MSEPIKVTRAQWDDAFDRYCHETDARDSFSRASARIEFARVLGPRPAPDTPPDLKHPYHHRETIASVEGSFVKVGTHHADLLLPWLEDHLLPWLRAQVEEAPDA